MHHDWISYARDELSNNRPIVLVTVAEVAGSAPRGAGACLAVGIDNVCGNIGGGNLEYSAIERSRQLMQTAGRQGFELEQVALGPSLGQCCGGNVTLAYEVLGGDDLLWLDGACAAEPGHLILSEFSASDGRRTILCGRAEARDLAVALGTDAAAADAAPCQLIRGASADRFILVRNAAEVLPLVVLFGAGHVGKALVHILAELPLRVLWIDTRPEMFASTSSSNVEQRASAIPESDVWQAPPGASYLVMTHDHGLDQEICAAVLKRGDFAFLGLIGSKTKRQRFMKEFRSRGLDSKVLDRLTCPIGVAGISGKRPESIAVAVAAQLLQVLEGRHATSAQTSDVDT